MAVLEVEVKDDGSIGKLPEPLQKFLDSRFNEAFGKGAEKAAKEAQGQIDEAVKKAREEERQALASNASAAERERLKTVEAELSKRKEEDAKKAQDYAAAEKIREERYQADLKEREAKVDAERVAAKAELEKRDARLRANVALDLKSEAIKANALPAAVTDIAELLTKFVELDADFLPTVKADRFRESFPESKLGADGKPVTIEGLVGEFLTLKPHNRAPVRGVGGRAAGGASMAGSVPKGANAEFKAAVDAVSADPSLSNAAEAMRRIGSARSA